MPSAYTKLYSIPENVCCCGDNKVSERVGELRRLYFQQIHQNLAEIHVRSVIFDKCALNSRPVYGILVENSLPLDRSKALNAKERFS